MKSQVIRILKSVCFNELPNRRFNSFGVRFSKLTLLFDNNCVHQSDVPFALPRRGFSYVLHTPDTNALESQERSSQRPLENVLEPCNEDVTEIAPYFQPTFNFAAYVNKSPLLQEFIKIGVDMHRWEKKKGIPQFVMKLDFERDVKKHLTFLHDLGIPTDNLGIYLTKNPLIFKEEIDVLLVRVNYLRSKEFTSDMVSRVIEVNPYWLMFSTSRIDRRLGHFQKTFALSGDQVRELVTKQPKLITYNMAHIKLMTFTIKEEMGFANKEIKSLLLSRPKLWMMDPASLTARFNFIHNIMKISHEQICEHPQILGSREFRTKQRHQFLSFLGRANYNVKEIGYIPLEKLVSGTDAEFCSNVAKSSVKVFNMFLKTL